MHDPLGSCTIYQNSGIWHSVNINLSSKSRESRREELSIHKKGAQEEENTLSSLNATWHSTYAPIFGREQSSELGAFMQSLHESFDALLLRALALSTLEAFLH